ncbi:hypothetical protein Nepgr_007479 [Nepenthes gracilis]|uniref:Uncharacterized protein n=1 Tax=Nepenthes gracilis TaxID=150966 RepID=A0AAD3XIE1_NEPGR|nr:hypothetical protein Nepgr_007479 [Nepenthes gracilis]
MAQAFSTAVRIIAETYLEMSIIVEDVGISASTDCFAAMEVAPTLHTTLHTVENVTIVARRGLNDDLDGFLDVSMNKGWLIPVK